MAISLFTLIALLKLEYTKKTVARYGESPDNISGTMTWNKQEKSIGLPKRLRIYDSI